MRGKHEKWVWYYIQLRWLDSGSTTTRECRLSLTAGFVAGKAHAVAVRMDAVSVKGVDRVAVMAHTGLVAGVDCVLVIVAAEYIA